MAASGVHGHEEVAIEEPEWKHSWEYHSRIYAMVEDVEKDLERCFSNRPYWQRMTKFKASQMDALPTFIWLKTSWQYEAACKFEQIDIPGMPPMCFCYRRISEYVFIRPIPSKVMEIEHKLTDDGLIALQFKNPFTGNVEVEQKFHITERLIDAKDAADRVLRTRGAMSNNTQITIIPKMSLTRQLRNIFSVWSVRGPTLRVRRRALKKTPTNEATSSSFRTCACSGCTGLRNSLLDNRDHDEYVPMGLDTDAESSDF